MSVFQQDAVKSCNGPTITAHIILVVSSFWSCYDLGSKLGFGIVGLVLYVATGLLGIILHSISICGDKTYKLYSNMWLWSLSLGLPSISSQLYTTSDFCLQVTVLHFIPPCLFIIFNTFNKRPQFLVLEIMQAVYLLAILNISFLNTNYYGFALAVSYSISFYVIGLTGSVQNTPAKDLLSFSLAFSNYFTVRTLQGN